MVIHLQGVLKLCYKTIWEKLNIMKQRKTFLCVLKCFVFRLSLYSYMCNFYFKMYEAVLAAKLTVISHVCLSHLELTQQCLKNDYDIFTSFKMAADKKNLKVNIMKINVDINKF